MKRYAVCQMIGSGTEEDMYRTACHEYGVTHSVAVAPSDDLIRGNKLWALVVVAADQAKFDQMAADSRIMVLQFGPDNLNDYWMNFGTSQERNQFANRVRSRTGLVIERDDSRTIGEIITYLGTNLDPNFDPMNLDVSDDMGM